MDPTISLTIDGISDVGSRRPNNEDAWWAGQTNAAPLFMVPGPCSLTLVPERAPILLMVSDGVGGSKAGEVASRLAVQTISEAIGRNPAVMNGSQSPGDAILAALGEADVAVKAKAAEPGFEGMGATLSILLFASSENAHWGQAGDSRIYVCRSGKLRQISRDHSPVSRMRQRGEITEAEARRHSQRNEIDQSLGNPDSPFLPECGTCDVLAGDVFLVCSDGLNDGLWDYEIEKSLAGVRSPSHVRPTVRRLVNAANHASGRDNITALVALVGKAAPGRAASQGQSFLRSLFRQ